MARKTKAKVTRKSKGEAALNRILKSFEKNALRSLRGLEVIADGIESGEVPGQSGLNRDMRQIAAAITLLQQEVVKHERLTLENAGLVRDAPLDLDAIKSEIGGKLDRIRDTLGSGAVPEGTVAG